MADDDRSERRRPPTVARQRSIGPAGARLARQLAAVVVVAVGVPLVYMFGSAIADGQQRAQEMPLRAMLGNQTYESLRDGDTTPLHYWGDDRRAPDFSLPDRHGGRWRLKDHRGKVVVMNFWSITCQPCVQEMPSLIGLAKLVKSRDDVEVVAVSTDPGWDAVATLFPKDSPLKVVFDPTKEVVQGRFGTRLYPETWIIDPEGVIRLRYDGPRNWSDPLVLELVERFL